MQVNLVRADLLVVGSISGDLAGVASDYERRLSRYVRLTVHELRAEPLQRGGELVARAEGERLAAALDLLAAAGSGSPHVVVLDPRGNSSTSEQIAEDWLAHPHLVLVVGGAFGIPDPILARADARVAFGRATLPHQLARVVATEQLYRAFRIARGEPYHH